MRDTKSNGVNKTEMNAMSNTSMKVRFSLDNASNIEFGGFTYYRIKDSIKSATYKSKDGATCQALSWEFVKANPIITRFEKAESQTDIELVFSMPTTCICEGDKITLFVDSDVYSYRYGVNYNAETWGKGYEWHRDITLNIKVYNTIEKLINCYDNNIPYKLEDDLSRNEELFFALMIHAIKKHKNSGSKNHEELRAAIDKVRSYTPNCSEPVPIYYDVNVFNAIYEKYEPIWENLHSDKERHSIYTLDFFSRKLDADILNGELLFNSMRTSDYKLTPWGVENLKEIIPFIEVQYMRYIHKEQKPFFESLNSHLLYDAANSLRLDYDINASCLLNRSSALLWSEVFDIIPEELTECHLLCKGELICKTSCIVRKNNEIAYKKIADKIAEFVRDAENEYRVSKGYPKIGEGWISETELYYEIKAKYKKTTVEHHASPTWLGRQHFDIYLPDYNIAIEYQGKQHYEAVDFFGGEESLKETQMRDSLKRDKCAENNCILIYVNEGYNMKDVVKEINKAIKQRA